MPQFSFRATDPRGNTVEGTLVADSSQLATYQVRQMGYAPVQVNPVEAHLVPLETIAMPDMATVGVEAPVNARPMPMDLTQPVMEMPAAANALMDETAVLQGGHLEPWQRGGPAVQPQAQAVVNPIASGAVTQPTTASVAVQTASMPSIYEGQKQTGREGVSIPYGAGSVRNVPLAERFKVAFIYPLFSGVPQKELSPFYRQFATLINAGLSLHQALGALEGNTQNAKLKEIAREAQRQVQAGGKFSDVLASYPWVFPAMHYEMIRAAEMGGLLDQVLIQIADYVDHELMMRRLIKAETFYPKLVLFVALMLLGRTMITQNTPAFSLWILGEMGKGSYSTLDYLGDTLGFGFLIILPFLVGTVLFRLFFFNSAPIREAYDQVKVTVPALGGIIRMFVLAKFLRTFASLYRAGFSMATTLHIAGEACGNAVLRKSAHRCIRDVERGGLISNSLGTSGFFPPMVIDMVRTGETTGNMDEMLTKAAEFYEGEAKAKSHQAALIFSVLVLLLVGILVAIAVISFYTGYSSGVSGAGGS